MRNRLSKAELTVWAVLAFAGGFVPAWIDSSARDAQGPALALMVVCFVLTLPGRAPAALVAIATWLAMPMYELAITGRVNLGIVIALVPAFIAAFGGALAGSLLDRAASQLPGSTAPEGSSWVQRPLTTRFLLALALVVIAALGYAPLSGILMAAGSRAPARWVALVWQIMTLLGWIGIAPLLLSLRSRIPGVRLVDMGIHILAVGLLAVIHATVIIGLTGLLAIPLTPVRDLARGAFALYLPLDLLAYVAILTLGFLSDAGRQRREAEQRAASLEAESLEIRLSALRARLNPHFLFNALNSVNVLARSGKTEETGRLVEGLTRLLRYVLDERRATVPLREELAFAAQYLDVQHVRFGDRLTYDVVADPAVESAAVPQLLLQPIVENAVEHGVARSLEGGRVTIAASVEGKWLRVTVDDDALPPAPSPDASAAVSDAGIGLATTRERLRRLYGDRARLALASKAPAAGTRVMIDLPLDLQ